MSRDTVAFAPGFTVTTGAVSQRAALPPTTAGQPPRSVRVVGTGTAYVMFGDSSVSANVDTVLLVPGRIEAFSVVGCSHMAYVQEAAPGVKINLVPLEG
ncbi:MAG: hypothetical protein K2Q10_03750 [Rhodospirillales bacterium]|nr:hypothetical protein [Rhodospirillales bacterium]